MRIKIKDIRFSIFDYEHKIKKPTGTYYIDFYVGAGRIYQYSVIIHEDGIRLTAMNDDWKAYYHTMLIWFLSNFDKLKIDEEYMVG